MQIFGTRLKAVRQEKGCKQKDMAQLLECSLRHYQSIEAGEINLPSKKLALLADFFQVSMDWLMGRTDRREVNR